MVRRRLRVHPALALGVTIAATAALAARDQQQVFRADVRTVPIYATVTDAKGAIVANLTAADFEIDDNNQKQAITVFKSDVQPITIAILLDRSPSLFPVEPLTRTATVDFAHDLIAGDRAVLGTFSQAVSLDPTFTNDADTLARHLGDDVPFPAGTALWDAIDAGRTVLEPEGGRRVLLIVTDAEDNCSRVDVDTTRTKLVREGVMVYAIGVKGREGLDAGALGALARATGGWFFELQSTDDAATTAQRVADELHRQYVLGFAPQHLDDKTHRLDIKLKRPGLTVHARRSYIASVKDDVR